MSRYLIRAACILILVAVAPVAFGERLPAAAPIENWSAPPVWTPPASGAPAASPDSATSLGPISYGFVGLTPCRIADTRGNGFTGAYGPPSLAAGVPRDFVMYGQCGVPPTAAAVSLNITVTSALGPGFILIYPQGAAQPVVSTLNYVAGQTVANAAVVPLPTSGTLTGAITVIAGVSGTDLIIDINGYYSNAVVNTLNGLIANVTLSGGTDLTIAPVPVSTLLFGVAMVGGSTAASIHAAELAANAATNVSTPDTIVKRDGSGNVQVEKISAAGFTQPGTGAETLKTLRGAFSVAAPPVIAAGGGFSVSRPSAGCYQVVFTTPFGGTPAMTFSLVSSLGAYLVMTNLASTKATFCTITPGGVTTDVGTQIHFIAVGNP